MTPSVFRRMQALHRFLDERAAASEQQQAGYGHSTFVYPVRDQMAKDWFYRPLGIQLAADARHHERMQLRDRLLTEPCRCRR